MHKARSIKECIIEIGVGEPEWPAQIPDPAFGLT